MERKIYDVMIEGDLIVAGDIIDNNYLMLQVMGNVVCDYFFSKNGHQYIKGDLIAAQAVRGEFIYRFGEIGDEYDGEIGRGWTYIKNSGSLFNPKTLDEDGGICRAKIYRYD